MPTHRPPIVVPVVRRVYDVKDIVERLDPGRHAPQPAYEFSRGRRFVKPEGTEYQNAPGELYDYQDQLGEDYGDG